MQLNHDTGPMDQQLVYRINDTGIGPELLEQVFLERGWTEYDEEVHGADGWNIWWRTTRFRTGEYTSLLPWQWINHFPSCALLTKKDGLCRNIRKMRVVHGFHVYNFCPQGFNLPNDYTKFVSEYANGKQQKKKEAPPTWICKPAESSRGRGIFVFSELADLQYDCNAVVQQYIADPLLIGGYKFDIRVYVAVPSFQPLQIYVHEEGLVRFSTEKYDLARLDNVFSHLTNTSINKHSPGYMTDKEEVGHGCKWTISQLRRYFLQNNINDSNIWQQITNIIVLTVLIQAPSAPKINNCFELYGFDILIDQSLKAWLLEVNFSPSLAYDCQVDVIAKKAMLHDLMTLLDFSDANLELMPSPQSPRHYRDGHTARTSASTKSDSSHQTSSTSSGYHHGSSRYSRSHRASLSDRRVRGGRQRNVSSSSSGLAHSSSTAGRPLNVSSGSCVSISSMQTTNRTENLVSVQPTKTNCVSSQAPSSMAVPNSKATAELDPKENNSQGGINYVDRVSQSKSNSFVFRHESLDKKEEQSPEASSSEETGRVVEEASGQTINAVKGGEFHVSNNSDSGLSSMSSNCDNQGNDNNNGVSKPSHSNANLKGGSTPVSFSENQDAATVQKSACIGAEIIDKLQNTQRLIAGHDGMEPSAGVDALDLDNIAEESQADGNNYEVKLVKGNMKGQGVKQIFSPIPALNLKRDKQNIFVGRNARHKTDAKVKASPKDRPLKPKSHNASPLFNSGANAYRDKHPVPRNLSVLEATRFQHHFYHGFPANHSPGKNGRAPLSKIPKKKVGRLYLVFPFNEATQKLSTAGKVDARPIIKEILRKGAMKKKQEASTANSEEADGHNDDIWVPIKSAD